MKLVGMRQKVFELLQVLRVWHESFWEICGVHGGHGESDASCDFDENVFCDVPSLSLDDSLDFFLIHDALRCSRSREVGEETVEVLLLPCFLFSTLTVNFFNFFNNVKIVENCREKYRVGVISSHRCGGKG